jgi:hypothetical protein
VPPGVTCVTRPTKRYKGSGPADPLSLHQPNQGLLVPEAVTGTEFEPNEASRAQAHLLLRAASDAVLFKAVASPVRYVHDQQEQLTAARRGTGT